MSWADNKGRGDKRYCLVEVGWHRDAKIMCKSVLAKWLHLILWETARDEARNVLSADCAEPEWLAGEMGSGTTPEEARAALEELCPGLVEVMEDGGLWIKGIQRKHRRISTWKDSEPTNTQPIGLSQSKSTAVDSSRDVTGRDVTGQDRTGREVSSAAPTRVSDPQKESPKSERIDYEGLRTWWNDEIVPKTGLSTVRPFGDAAKKKIRTRAKDKDNPLFSQREKLTDMLLNLNEFTRNGTWLDLHWILESENNLGKLLRGKYRDKEPSKPKPLSEEWPVPPD